MLVQCVSVEPPLGLGKGWSSPPPRKCSPAGGEVEEVVEVVEGAVQG